MWAILVFPVDTFVHMIVIQVFIRRISVKDYWIVHGFLIDYIQALFFKIFGNEWNFIYSFINI